MARSLSPLQKFILVEALKRRTDPKLRARTLSQTHLEDLYFFEVLHGWWGFPYWRKAFRYDGDFETFMRWVLTQTTHFKPAQIGKNRYQSAVASLSRSIARLERRSLVLIYAHWWLKWTGIDLTPTGYQVAENIASKGDGYLRARPRRSGSSVPMK